MFLGREEHRMKTITICGSMQFEAQMRKIAWLLETKHGYNVLQCVYKPENEECSSLDREVLNLAHREKITLSDAIYVVDIQGTIGTATAKEI